MYNNDENSKGTALLMSSLETESSNEYTLVIDDDGNIIPDIESPGTSRRVQRRKSSYWNRRNSTSDIESPRISRRDQRRKMSYWENTSRENVLPMEEMRRASFRRFQDAAHVEVTSGSAGKWYNFIRYVILGSFLCMCIAFYICSILQHNQDDQTFKLMLKPNSTNNIMIPHGIMDSSLNLKLTGPLLPNIYASLAQHHIQVWFQLVKYHRKDKYFKNHNSSDESRILDATNVTSFWMVPLALQGGGVKNLPAVQLTNLFSMSNITAWSTPQSFVRMLLMSDVNETIPVTLQYGSSPPTDSLGLISASICLLIYYFLIATEIFNRTLTTVLFCAIGFMMLTVLGKPVSVEEVILWVMEAPLIVVFALMILNTIMAESGTTQMLAAGLVQKMKENIWVILYSLLLVTVVLSSLLSSVIAMMLMLPVVIRVCELLKLPTEFILMCLCVFCNIGGSLSPFGTSTNLILLLSHPAKQQKITGSLFTLHIFTPLIICLVLLLVFMLCRKRWIEELRYSEAQNIRELQHEVCVWQKAVAKCNVYSQHEERVYIALLRKLNRLIADLRHAVSTGRSIEERYRASHDQSHDKVFNDKTLLLKSIIVVGTIMCLLSFHPLLQFHSSVRWVTMVGAIVLLLLANQDTVIGIFSRIEWNTLLLLAGFQVIVKIFNYMGFKSSIIHLTSTLLQFLREDIRFPITMIIFSCATCLVALFLGSTNAASMMLCLLPSLNKVLQQQPIIWSIAFGAIAGGSATVFGCTSSLICVGVSEQHGYNLHFLQFSRFGLKIMVMLILTSTIYLMVAHVLFSWH